jgi:hypothetical protein
MLTTTNTAESTAAITTTKLRRLKNKHVRQTSLPDMLFNPYQQFLATLIFTRPNGRSLNPKPNHRTPEET